MIWIDVGHGQDNRTRGVYDPGAKFGKFVEAAIVREVAHGVMALTPEGSCGLAQEGCLVARIAWQRRTLKPKDLFVSLHMNAGGGTGTEVLYATTKLELRTLAAKLSDRFSTALGIRDRGAKTDDSGQHSSLGILRVPGIRSLLLELAFIDRVLDVEAVNEKAAMALAEILPDLAQA